MSKSNKKKILLVDDDTISMELAKIILQEEYEVTTAGSGNEALTLLLNNYKPDLVLLDVIMPELSGWETYNRIRGISLLCNVPIAFLTTLTAFEGFEQAKKLGAADYITKPFDNVDLLERVAKMVSITV